MKLFIISVLLSVCHFAYADKLTNRYLPPNHAASSAGHGSYLQGPGHQQQSTQYQTAGSSHYNTAAGHQTYSTHSSPPVPILRETASNDGNGNYNFGFETGNGIRRDETGVFQPGHPDGSQTVTGSYSFVGDDGHTYTVNYRADNNGFHAEGAHLPTPPPIPKEIQESLALHHTGHHGGHSTHSAQSSRGGFGGHHAAASVQQPSAQYLPAQQQRRGGYNYGPGQY